MNTLGRLGRLIGLFDTLGSRPRLDIQVMQQAVLALVSRRQQGRLSVGCVLLGTDLHYLLAPVNRGLMLKTIFWKGRAWRCIIRLTVNPVSCTV